MVSRSALVAFLLLGAVVAQADPNAWIITTDYSTFGRVRSCTGPSPWSVSGDLATIPGDAVGRHHDGLVYIIGRGGTGVLQVYDPAQGFALVHEFSLGANRNPQDIAFDTAGEAYIPCYDTAELLRVDVANETILASISTAAFADADGRPETAWCAADGDRLYIACQKLDTTDWNYPPTGPGAILVFDMATEQWVDQDAGAPGVQPIVLQGANPYTRLSLDGGILTVGCLGQLLQTDGGIERVDLATGMSLGYAVTEAALGGDILAMVPDGDAWLALVSDATFTTRVRRAEGGSVTTLDTGSGYVHADLLLDGGDLLVLDRTNGASGLRVLDPLTGAPRSGAVMSTGLAPFMFVPPTAPTSPVPIPRAAALSLGAPYPNPCNPAATVGIRARPEAAVGVTVVDLRGRRVSAAVVRTDAAGRGTFTFDGRDAAGRVLPAGVYRVVARHGGERTATAVTLLK